MLKSKDFTVEITGYYAESAPRTISREPITLRVFWDDSWTTKKDILLNMSGGSGLNPISLPSDKVEYTASKDHVFIDLMSNPNNFPYRANIYFSNGLNVSRAMEIPLALNEIYENIIYDSELSSILTNQSKIKIGGHSRGAGTVLEYIAMLTSGSNQFVTPYYNNISRYTINSPTGNNANGHSNALNSLDEIAGFVQFCDLPLLFTVGAGDITHTTKAMITRLYYESLLKNPKVIFKVVGGETFTHSYPNKYTNNEYKAWIDLICDGDSPYA